MKILILGASGMVGNAIFQVLSNDYEVYGTFNRNKPGNSSYSREKYWLKYDIAEAATLSDILEDIKPDLVISSLTGNFEHQLNAHKQMAEYLKKSSGRCIFISTLNVFDGSTAGDHTEDVPPYPISTYGRYKRDCEKLLQEYLESNLLIVRLPKILSKTRAQEMIEQVESGQPVFSNLYMNLNTAENVAKAVKYCIEAGIFGILHLASHDYMSFDETTRRLFAYANKAPQYIAAKLTTQSYCSLLGCDDPASLKCSDDGNFYLTIRSINADISVRFGISCEEVIDLLGTVSGTV